MGINRLISYLESTPSDVNRLSITGFIFYLTERSALQKQVDDHDSGIRRLSIPSLHNIASDTSGLSVEDTKKPPLRKRKAANDEAVDQNKKSCQGQIAAKAKGDIVQQQNIAASSRVETPTIEVKINLNILIKIIPF